MAARISIQILTGPNGSARAARMDALLREAGGGGRLLVPSVAQARVRREALLSVADCPGAWGMPVWSLTDFARHLLETEGVPVTRIESAFQQGLLVEHCLAMLRTDLPDTYLARIAPTPGLVRHLLGVINDLKQSAIEPEVFAERIPDAAYQSPLDEGVAAVYQRYQDTILAGNCYDVPGLYWRADELLARGTAPRALAGIDTLLWDGFDDFTPSEFRFLASLLGQVDRGAIGLNLDGAPDRQDRYALPLSTLAKLREHFDCQVVSCEAPEPRSYVEFAARHIFWREEPALPEGLDANLAIVPCSDGVHELETIARRVKGLIVEEGVPSGEIAVVYWNLLGIADSLRTVFEGFGIPCQLAVQRPLAETGVGRTLVNLFCNTGDWEREGILELLGAPCLRDALWGDLGPPYSTTDARKGGTGVPPVLQRREALLGTIEATAYYARRAQILEGFKDWQFRLTRLRERVERGESKEAKDLLRRRPGAASEIEALLAATDRLKEFQQVLPEQATPLDLATALDRVLDQFAVDPEDGAELEAVAGIRALLELLAEAPGAGEKIPRAAFLDRFSRGMEETACTVRGTTGGVVCLDANQIRNRRFPHVFVAGLMEGQVPATPSTNSVYPEHDRERLHAAGIPVEANQAHHARQRMLFGHVLECAAQSLTLSWPLTQDSGRESSPSPFLTDVRELFPEAAGVVAPYPRADSFLPPHERIASPRDAANRALYDAPPIAKAFPELCAAPETGVAIEAQRQSEAPFGPYDGVLGDPGLVDAIAKDYGPDHEFSVNQLEGYLACPFSFFTQRILYLEDTELPDGTVTPLVRGSLIHDTLQLFHERFAGLHVCEIGLEKADAAMEAALDEIFANHDWSDSSAPPAARTAEKMNLRSRLLRYLRVENARDDERGWKPAHFEAAFGRTCTERDAAPSTTAPFVMETEAGPVRFTGRIDRIDRDGDSARIIDYKTGAVPASGDITRGERIQLSVYAEAVTGHLLPGVPCTEAYYLPVGKKERREALGIGQTRWNWPEREANTKAAIERAVDGIRRGVFPPVRAGKTCYGCGHARACRHEEARIARKTAAASSETLQEPNE